MISVVAPCLNEEKLINVFLESLVRQSYRDFEVVLVDGGSTDKTVEIIKSYKDKLNVKLVVDETRNLGYVRNIGARQVKGDIMLQCNTDNYLEPLLLQKLAVMFQENPETVSIGGRVYPLGTSLMEHLAYQCFDFIRFLFTCFFMPIRKYRPSGNFMSIRTNVFWRVGGFPEVKSNEDGLLGQRLDEYAYHNHKAVVFSLKLYMGHYIRKFQQMGGVQAVLFYLYVFGNFAPMLKPLLKPIQINADSVFSGEGCTRLSVGQVASQVWDWL